jgi:hypothetical protein
MTNPAPTSKNKVNDRLRKNVDQNNDGIISSEEANSFGNDSDNGNPTETAKENYTALRYGNDKGSISFGHIHKPGDVTAGVMLQTHEGDHKFFMDGDGQRKGWTSSVSPNNFQVTCGHRNEEAQDSMFLHAANGNIVIVATNGKIRMQATDIEMIAVGEGGSKGNIRLKATENIETDSKKLLMNAKNFYKLASSGSAEVVANSQMKIYSSIIRGVSDACALKDSKNAHQKIQVANSFAG